MSACRQIWIAIVGSSLGIAMESFADEFQPNYDESQVPTFVLPDPLVDEQGQPVTTPEQWRSSRRPESFALFQKHVYGRSPAPRRPHRVELIETDAQAINGTATRKQVALYLTNEPDGPRIDVLLYVPNARTSPAPGFLGLNFQGNQAVHADPAIRMARGWVKDRPDGSADENRANENSRGVQADNWVVERLVARGYALVTAYYGDLEPDHPQGWRDGIRGVIPVDDPTRTGAGHITELRPDDWGAIGAWAWGLSRILDYLETDADIDAHHVAVIGHSRLGKTALWAAASDERFAMAVSNNSGEGGAALARRQFGETTARINTAFPHWFCGNFKQYNDRVNELPVDQHELLALIAPRPLYVASATEDRWADPRGEFLSALRAGPVYELFGRKGLGQLEPPLPDQSIGRTIGYHLRTGPHAMVAFDWEQYLNFADRHWFSPASTDKNHGGAEGTEKDMEKKQ